MKIRIDAPRAWGWTLSGKLVQSAYPEKDASHDVPVCIVHRKDLRKLIAVARAAEDAQNVDRQEDLMDRLLILTEKLDALRGKK